MALEFERKALLCEADYVRLLAYFGAIADGTSYTQVNTYYDTPSFDLARSHRTLRVREKNGAFEQQYKYKQASSGELRTATEYCIPVAALPAEIEGSSLPDGDAVRYRPIGSLTTERTDFYIAGALVSLDKSRYLGKVDYEIEVETEGDLPLPREVLTAGIDFSGGSVGKFHRFLTRYRAMK